MVVGLEAFEVNKIRPRRGGVATRVTARMTPLPGRTVFPLNRRVNTPTGPMITGNSGIGINALVTRTNNFIDTPVCDSMSKAIFGMSASVSTANCHGPYVVVGMRNSR